MDVVADQIIMMSLQNLVDLRLQGGIKCAMNTASSRAFFILQINSSTVEQVRCQTRQRQRRIGQRFFFGKAASSGIYFLSGRQSVEQSVSFGQKCTPISAQMQ